MSLFVNVTVAGKNTPDEKINLDFNSSDDVGIGINVSFLLKGNHNYPVKYDGIAINSGRDQLYMTTETDVHASNGVLFWDWDDLLELYNQSLDD